MSKEPKKPKADEAEPEKPEVKAEEEEAVEEKRKPAKEKVAKKKKKDKGIFQNYKIGETGITRLRPFCERCGPGYFMADHGNRFSCGHCGFTRYKQNPESEA